MRVILHYINIIQNKNINFIANIKDKAGKSLENTPFFVHFYVNQDRHKISSAFKTYFFHRGTQSRNLVIFDSLSEKNAWNLIFCTRCDRRAVIVTASTSRHR